MSITVEILPAAQRMLEAADERRIDEHGLDVDNPLFDQIKHASDLASQPDELNGMCAVPIAKWFAAAMLDRRRKRPACCNRNA